MHADEYGDAGMGHEPQPMLNLGADDRLPWLESADDDDLDQPASGRGFLIGVVVAALIVLGMIVGGIYWFTHRGGPERPADGSLIEASKDPYKVAPSDPGGKKFAGTGDSSFKVSQGEHPDASLAGSAGTTPAPAPAPGPVTATSAPAIPATPAAPAKIAPVKPDPNPQAKPAAGGVPVQVGAYSTSPLAEAAWARLTAGHDLLKGLNHRVVEAKADIGVVYRLQAMAADGGAATSLCSHLEADGVKCQVKH